MKVVKVSLNWSSERWRHFSYCRNPPGKYIEFDVFYFLDTLSVGYFWWIRIFLNQKIIHEGKQGLKKFISQIGGLSDGTMIDAGEKIMAFMTIIRDNTYRDTAAIWQHGYRQICASVH